ncbi:hypothetical protein LO772_29855 [Yinghuangia sp. ASG 101]|uniref:hypothetical protein n=1 Tax=Yinghuangia sp. ASG 101 TaxID=2896848 RepID=UPI001E393286|nr:hypothetical protein [Yinghuangia sp. ASG 101]UGQ10972.1 hypothetical protein LO772_29855 [Yinghuangia sp. ASG 101]
MDRFCEAVGAQRGRRIVRRPLPLIDDREIPCGMWVATSTTDYIFTESDTPRSHRDHIVVHEIAHMLCGHASSIDADLAQFLLPTTNPTMIRLLMGRTGYATADEQEAEMMATLIMERAHRGVAPAPAHSSKGLKRLGATLGHHTTDSRWR